MLVCFLLGCVLVVSLAHTPASVPASDVVLEMIGEEEDGSWLDDVEASELFYCRKCGEIIARGRSFMPSAPEYDRLLEKVKTKALAGRGKGGEDGEVLRFASPQGVRHDVALFRREMTGSIDVERTGKLKQSYFPGYAWHVASCNRCGAHVGWMFEKPSAKLERLTEENARGGISGKGSVQAKLHSQDDERRVLAPLLGHCVLHSEGYWQYRVCFGSQVRQFHAEGGKVIESQDWSLGTFDKEGKVERVSASPQLRRAGYYTSHFFRDGQHCDETGKGRRSEVQYMCCPPEAVQEDSRESKRAGVRVDGHNSKRSPTSTTANGLARVMDISEPSTCKYLIRVCTPFVCENHDPRDKEEEEVEEEVEEEEEEEEDDDGGVKGPKRFFAALWPALVGDKSNDLAWIEDLNLTFYPKIGGA